MTLTPEQLAEIDKRMGEAIKNAFTGDAFKGVLRAELAPVIEGATKPLAEKLATLEAGAKKPETPPSKKAEESAGVPAEVQAQINALKAQLTESQEKAKAAERAALKDRASGAVRDALGKAGVPADRMDLALAWVEANGVVKLADDGSFHFEGAEQYGVRPKVDATAWAGEFIKTNTGKALLPAAPTQGAGGQPGQNGGGNAGQLNSVNQLLGFAPN
jgi:hypothetical protein